MKFNEIHKSICHLLKLFDKKIKSYFLPIFEKVILYLKLAEIRFSTGTLPIPHLLDSKTRPNYPLCQTNERQNKNSIDI